MKGSPKTNKSEEIGKRLTLAREKAGDTVSNVAQQLGVSTKSVYTWESGQYEAPLAYIDYAVLQWNVSADWLLTGKGRQKPSAPTQTESTELEVEPDHWVGEGENKNLRSYEEMEVDYDELATAVVDLLEITRDSSETFRYSLMKQLKSCFLVQDHVEILRKKGNLIKTAVVAASSIKDHPENFK